MKRSINRPQGFTLIELAVVFAIIALLLFLFIPTNTSMIIGQRRANTIQKLANIETALTNFVVVNKRLPCPADGAALLGTEGGRDANGDCNNPAGQANGVVPWVALGMALNDVLDSWDNQITYRVGYGLTRNGALDMSSCDPAGTASETVINAAPSANLGLCNVATCVGTFAAANCTSPQNFLTRKGLDIKSSAAVTAMNYLQYTGAAYVLISHGENGYGAINNAGVYRDTATRGIAGTTLENPNRNLPALIITNGAPPQFMSANYSDANDATIYFDDIVVRPMLMSVINKAQLGPRSH